VVLAFAGPELVKAAYGWGHSQTSVLMCSERRTIKGLLHHVGRNLFVPEGIREGEPREFYKADGEEGLIEPPTVGSVTADATTRRVRLPVLL
jgi:hypothetical protein